MKPPLFTIDLYYSNLSIDLLPRTQSKPLITQVPEPYSP